MSEYSGYKRSLYVSVTKAIGGEVIVGYPKTYPTATDIARGYFIYNYEEYPIPDDNELSYMSDTDYNELVSAFESYVEDIENVSFIDDEINVNVEYDPINCSGETPTTTSTTLAPVCNINYTILPHEFSGSTVTVSYTLTSGTGSIMVELIGSSGGVIGTNLEHTTPITNYFTDVPIGDEYQIVFTDLGIPDCSRFENLSWCETCEEGYTPIGDDCVLYETIDPTYYSSTYTVVRKAEHSSYGLYGAVIFDDWNYDGTGDYERIPTSNQYWINTPYPSLEGPLNRSCVWGNVTRDNQDIGFSFCFNIAVPKTYYVGFGCDNLGKVKLNGSLILEQDISALATMFAANGDPTGGGDTGRIPFRYWFIYPIELPAGENFIEVIGHNETNVAGVGIHIYDATPYDLINATSDEDLGDKKIFDSIDLVGTALHYEYSATNGYHGYVCPIDYALNTCDEPFTCVKATVEPCFTGETTYFGSWLDYVCIIDSGVTTTTIEPTTTLEPTTTTIEPITGTTTTLEPITGTTTVQPIETVNLGFLYNWLTVDDARNIANTGWHVPTNDELGTLLLYIDPDGTRDVNDASGHLKETGLTHWENPNIGATNTYGFNARGSGQRFSGGAYNGKYEFSNLWTTTENPYDTTQAFFGELYHNTIVFRVWLGVSSFITQFKKIGNCIRLVKDSTTLSHGESGTYQGNDGKLYRTICIGTQEWLADNLKETQWRNNSWIDGYDGGVYTPIGDSTWDALTTSALCAYDDVENNA